MTDGSRTARDGAGGDRSEDGVGRWLTRAARVAADNVNNGGGPFGAVIVRADGHIVAESGNRVVATPDPTAHAEVMAIRQACQSVGDFSLAGMTLYASCEPCPMCFAACHWARLEEVWFDADRQDAARAGFDDALLYELLQRPDAAQVTLQTPVRRGPPSGASAVLEAWRKRPDVTRY